MDKLLFKYFRGEATLEDKQAIEVWLNTDPIEHTQYYKAARFVFEGSVIYDYDRRANLQPRYLKTMWRVSRYVAGVAAVLLLVIGAGFWGQKVTYDDLSSKLIVLDVPAGQRIQVSLPDGSQVWLNSMTRMEYPVAFQKDERRVRLSGEAMFDVVHNAAQPFIVETFATEVEVLGTKFNVVANSADHTFSTMLLQGSVKVINLLKRQPAIVMSPDETVNLVCGNLSVERNLDASTLCWIDGQVNINGQTFTELMSKFEKAFGVKIVMERGDILNTDFIRGKVRISDGIDHALRVLQHGADFTYKKDEMRNTIIIL